MTTRTRSDVLGLSAIVLFGALGCAPPQAQQGASFEPTEEISSTAQALSVDPGPTELFRTRFRFDRFTDAHSDGTYVYVRYYIDSDKYCWGRVLRAPIGGGAVTLAEAPCYTRDFVVDHDNVYFAAVYDPFTQSSGGIYRATFGVDGWTRLTTVAAQTIAADEAYLYWNDAAALHRVLHDGTGDEILAANAAGLPPLMLGGEWIYGYDGADLWKVPKQGGEKQTLATIGAQQNISGLQLDDGELFWVDSTRLYVDGTQLIERLPITGGSPTTFYSTTNGMRGLAVECGWVYWSTGLDLQRRARTGGMIQDVDTAEPESEVIGADATNIYYTRWTTPAPPVAALRRMPVADIAAPVCDDAPRKLVDAASSLGLAASGTWVYYTEGDSVRRVWKNGGSTETMAVNQPGARALHVDARSLAWVTDDGVNTTPFQWPVDRALYIANAEDVITAGDGQGIYYNDGARIVGPKDTTLATGFAPYALARDSRFVYWTDAGDQSLRRVPVAGGNVELMARLDRGEIGDLALGPDQVFFASDRGALGTIQRVAKAGGPTTRVALGAFSPFDLEASGSQLYFSSQGPGNRTVFRVAKTGGKVVALAKGEPAFELDTLQSCVYYVTATQVAVVSKL